MPGGSAWDSWTGAVRRLSFHRRGMMWLVPDASMVFRLALLLIACIAPAGAAAKGDYPPGWIILSGGTEEGGEPTDALDIFRRLAGGPHATIIYIPTAASELRLPDGQIFEIPENGPVSNRDVFEAALAKLFGVRRVQILHTRDRAIANSEAFVKPLHDVRAVWISGGNAGRLIDTYLGSRTEQALHAVLERGGVIGGTSAGAIILGSYVVRGRADKPVLMAKGREQGFGFLPGIAVDPHFIAAHRQTELITVVDWHPELLGLGVDTGAAGVIHNGKLTPLGTAKIGVYDNVRHSAGWYYMMKSGTCLDLRARAYAEHPCDSASTPLDTSNSPGAQRRFRR